jgi:hypothetical protein
MKHWVPSICPYCQSTTDIQHGNEASCENNDHEFWFHVYKSNHTQKIDEYWFIHHKQSNLIIDNHSIAYNDLKNNYPPLLVLSKNISMHEAANTLNRFLKLHAFI